MLLSYKTNATTFGLANEPKKSGIDINVLIELAAERFATFSICKLRQYKLRSYLTSLNHALLR